MDHFEAVAEGYEDGLATFVAGAARDGMANLAKVAAGFTAQPASVTAIVGGRLIDGTGKPAVENSVVILKTAKLPPQGQQQALLFRRRADCGRARQKRAAGVVGDARAL